MTTYNNLTKFLFYQWCPQDINQLIMNNICHIRDLCILWQVSSLHRNVIQQFPPYQNWKVLYVKYAEKMVKKITRPSFDALSFNQKLFVIACKYGNPVYKYIDIYDMSVNLKVENDQINNVMVSADLTLGSSDESAIPNITPKRVHLSKILIAYGWGIHLSCVESHFDIARDIFFNCRQMYLKITMDIGFTSIDLLGAERVKEYLADNANDIVGIRSIDLLGAELAQEYPLDNAIDRLFNEVIFTFVDNYSSISKKSILTQLCRKGNLSDVQSFIKFGEDIGHEIDIHAYDEESFRKCLEKGNVDIAEWLLNLSKKSPYRLIDVHADEEYILYEICTDLGDVKILKWFIEEVCADPLIGPIDYFSHEAGFFVYSCVNNHLDIAKYWIDYTKMHELPLTPDISQVFRFCCLYNSMSVVKWLVELKLEFIENQMKNNEIQLSHDLQVISELDVHEQNDDAFLNSITSASFDVAEYLLEIGENSLIGKFHVDIGKFMKMFCEENHIHCEENHIHCEGSSDDINKIKSIFKWIINIPNKYSHIASWNFNTNKEALSVLAMNNNLETAQALFEYSLDINDAIDLHTPFLTCCQKLDMNSAMRLIEIAHANGKPINIHMQSEIIFITILMANIDYVDEQNRAFSILKWLIDLSSDPVYGPFDLIPIKEFLVRNEIDRIFVSLMNQIGIDRVPFIF